MSFVLRPLARVILIFCLGTWPKRVITNGDAVRLNLACEIMQIAPRDSICNTAINAFGTAGLNKTV